MEPRTRSRDSALPGYTDSKRIPSPGNPGRVGQGRVGGFDYAAYAAKHFPNAEYSHGLIAAIWHVRKRHRNSYPAPAEVRELAEQKGWLHEARR